jgi:hypothetical protein
VKPILQSVLVAVQHQEFVATRQRGRGNCDIKKPEIRTLVSIATGIANHVGSRSHRGLQLAGIGVSKSTPVQQTQDLGARCPNPLLNYCDRLAVPLDFHHLSVLLNAIENAQASLASSVTVTIMPQVTRPTSFAKAYKGREGRVC